MEEFIELKDLQDKAIEIYEYFDKLCKENNLRYYICGGCCIGAVRHKGFIPWDDDIDVFMPRPDYEKLYEIWNIKADTKKYSLCRTTLDTNYHSIVTLLKDNNTTFINKHSIDSDINHGYMIDIIPIDGCAPKGIKRVQQKINASIFSLFNAQRLPDNQGKLVRKITALVLSIVKSKKLRYKIWKSAESRMTKYNYDESKTITELATGFKYMKNEYPKEIFSEQLYVDFENIKIPIPIGYDMYLTMAFGDYMTLPPKENQKPKHNVSFVDLENSYINYKGKEYLLRE